MYPKKLNIKSRVSYRVVKLWTLCLITNFALPHAAALCAEPEMEQSWLDKQDISGSLDYETYQYPKTPLFPGQVEQNHALRLQFRSETDLGENWRMGFQPFVRYDFVDDRQNTLRLDEGWVEYASQNWDLRVGNQVFAWGQMESVNLIDGLNARDYRDDIIEPTKIGVPTMRFRWKFDDSDLTFYALPYYMQSMFPGRYNFYSISGGMPIDNTTEKFEGQGAVRYFYAGDGYDFAVSYMNLIEHTPEFDLDYSKGELVATPYRAERFGIETTKVVGSLLLKAQGFYRIPQTPLLKPTFPYTVGAEYTFPGIVGLSDLTVFTEYFGSIGDGGQVRFQLLVDSLFTGIRWTANDQARQELEVGAINNFNHIGTYLMRASYTRNLTDSIQMSMAYTDTFGFLSFQT